MASAPLLRIAAMMIGGIVLADFSADVLSPRVWFLGFAVALLAAGGWRRRPLASSACQLVGVMMFGGWMMSRSQEIFPLPKSPITYEAVMTSEPSVHGKVVKGDLLITSGPLAGRRLKAAVLRDTLTRRYESLCAGCGMQVRSRLEIPHDFHRGNFNYSRWLTTHGFVARTFILSSAWRAHKVSLRKLSATDRLRLKALAMRHSVLRRFETQGLGGKAYALVAAMAIGDRSMLPEEVKTVFSQSGASHVLALSGLHLGVIYFFLTFCFRHYRRRLWQQSLLLTVVWGYVFVAGLPVSATRAATLLTIYAFVDLTDRSRSPLNTLSLAALVMLVGNPLLVWDVSFQMSMASVLGILLFYRPFYFLFGKEWMKKHRIMASVWGMAAVSLSAQIAVAPLVAYYFELFSTWFLLSNFVAVPLTTAIIFTTIALLLTTPVTAMQQVVVPVLDVLSSLLVGGLEFISKLPLATIAPIRINATQTVLCYLFVGIVAALVLLVRKEIKRRQYLKGIPF